MQAKIKHMLFAVCVCVFDAYYPALTRTYKTFAS